MRNVLTLVVSLVLLPSGLASAQDDSPAPDGPATEASPSRAIERVEQGQPRYLGAMERELRSMRVVGASCEPTDEERGHCIFTARGITTGREFRVHLVYSDRTDTIYVYVERYLTAAADGEHTNALLRRMMELNWSLLLGKFEWDATDGEVRLAMLINTDSNFDCRAFRSVVRSIGQVADRYFQELNRVANGG